MKFGFCGVYGSCQSYFASLQQQGQPINHPELVQFSDIYTFDVQVGQNTLKLDEVVHFTQGSMVVWLATSDSPQLAFMAYPSLPDYTWSGNTLYNTTMNSINVRICLTTLGQYFYFTSTVTFYQSFPNAGTYVVQWALDYKNNTQTCTVKVTESMCRIKIVLTDYN